MNIISQICIFLASVFHEVLGSPRLVNRLVFWDGKTTVYYSRPKCNVGQKIEFQPTWRFKPEWICDMVSYFVIIQDTVRHFISNSDAIVNDSKWIRNQDKSNNDDPWLVCPCNLSIPLHNVFLRNGVCTFATSF